MDHLTRLTTLQAFFNAEGHGRSKSVVDRYERVHAHLLRFLDEMDGSFCLGTHPAALLAAERQFGRDHAFFRVFGFDEVIFCLPEFISDSWLLSSTADARTQISLVERLGRWLSRENLFDRQGVACAYYEVEGAVRKARRRMRQPPDTPAEDDPWDPAVRARREREQAIPDDSSPW